METVATIRLYCVMFFCRSKSEYDSLEIPLDVYSLDEPWKCPFCKTEMESDAHIDTRLLLNSLNLKVQK